VVAIGDTVRIKVLDIDRDRQRISLGLKQTQEDPWQRVISAHRPGDVLEGNVTKVVAFGAFVEILPGVEGLVHISELADHHVESPSEVVEPGTSLNVKILEIDEERRRLSLSIKQVAEGKMAMGDLGEQIDAAAAGETSSEGSEGSTAGPVAESEGPAGGGEASVLDPSDSAPPAEDAAEPEEAPAAEVESPAVEEAPAAEEDQAEEAPAANEAPAAEAEPEEAEAPVAESPDETGEEQEGESVQERPDSPDDVDEAAGEDTEAESPAEDPSES
jgi:small subunit ribosomal protein S1